MDILKAEEIFNLIDGPILSASRCFFNKQLRNDYLQLSVAANKYKANLIRIYEGYKIQFIKIKKPKYNHATNQVTPFESTIIYEQDNLTELELKNIFNDLFNL